MISTPTVIDVPLRTDQDGVIRVGKTRVTLLTIVTRHRVGDSPEDIHRGFPTVALGDIYAVLAYYLAHQAEVDQYIANELAEAERWRQDYEASNPQAAESNARLRKLVEARRKKDQA
jgi:uncharacterized protein (DUF433 family)